jgi:hypothetical protein
MCLDTTYGGKEKNISKKTSKTSTSLASLYSKASKVLPRCLYKSWCFQSRIKYKPGT